MLEQGIRHAILELYRRGQGVRAIARALQVSRAAVREILRRGRPRCLPGLEGAPRTSNRHRLETQEMIRGGDPLPFGLQANRPTIEALIDYAYRQTIIPMRIPPEKMFAASALEA